MCKDEVRYRIDIEKKKSGEVGEEEAHCEKRCKLGHNCTTEY